MIQKVMLDTDILSAIMRRNPAVIFKARTYLSIHRQFTFSIITRYEILRGLFAKNATAQIANFNLFCKKSSVLSLTDEIIVNASEIYAVLRRQGRIISDADILISATALINHLGLVTNNEKHFSQIADLKIQNWLEDM